MSKTNYHELAVLNTARGTALTAWTPYIGLLSAITDAEAGTVTEVTTTLGLTRKAVTFGAPSAGGSMSNSAIVDFGAASAGGTVSAFGIYDAASAGNLRYTAMLTGGAKTVNASDPVSFAIAAITVSED